MTTDTVFIANDVVALSQKAGGIYRLPTQPTFGDGFIPRLTSSRLMAARVSMLLETFCVECGRMLTDFHGASLGCLNRADFNHDKRTVSHGQLARHAPSRHSTGLSFVTCLCEYIPQ